MTNPKQVKQARERLIQFTDSPQTLPYLTLDTDILTIVTALTECERDEDSLYAEVQGGIDVEKALEKAGMVYDEGTDSAMLVAQLAKERDQFKADASILNNWLAEGRPHVVTSNYHCDCKLCQLWDTFTKAQKEKAA